MSNDETATTNTKRRRRLVVLKTVGMVILYLLGLAWHFVHPFASIFTGDFDRARGLYVDESTMDPSYLKPKRQNQSMRSVDIGLSLTLCEAFREWHPTSSCHSADTMDVFQILPKQAAVVPTQEAVVIVLPYLKESPASVREALLPFVARLAEATWLSKTLFVISSNTVNSTDTVENFFQFYQDPNTSLPGKHPRSNFVSGALIRTVLIIDAAFNAPTEGGLPSKDEIRVLPQGLNGVLPNMDLISTAYFVYSTSGIIQRRDGAKFTVHPYTSQVQRWSEYLQEQHTSLSKLEPVLNMLAFEASLLFPHSSPAAPALAKHVDALTLQVRFRPLSGSLTERQQQQRQQAKKLADFVDYLDPLVRAISNLHERLHHSTSLYLLFNLRHFIKHEEYLVPNLLLVIPLLIQAAANILSAHRISWSTIFGSSCATLVATLLLAGVYDEFCDGANYYPFVTGFVVTVGAGLFGVRRFSGSLDRDSWHLVTCLTGAYIHAGIAFCHVSLAFPSALFWTPLILLSGHHRLLRFLGWCTALGGMWLCCTWSVGSDTLKLYLLYACIPLTTLLSIGVSL